MIIQPKHFGKTYSSSLMASREASEDLDQFWSSVGIGLDLASQLELCVVEMVNNAFIHAYQAQEGMPIELTCKIYNDPSDQQLELRISDYGSVMSQRDLEAKLANPFIEPDPADETTWATSGRGFIIVSSLMDKVELTTTEMKNTFLMVKELHCQLLTA